MRLPANWTNCILGMVGFSLGIATGACREDSPPTNAAAPPGEEKELSTKVLEKGAEMLQDLAPIRAIDH